jgi:hypothetical protein
MQVYAHSWGMIRPFHALRQADKVLWLAVFACGELKRSGVNGKLKSSSGQKAV